MDDNEKSPLDETLDRAFEHELAILTGRRVDDAGHCPTCTCYKPKMGKPAFLPDYLRVVK